MTIYILNRMGWGSCSDSDKSVQESWYFLTPEKRCAFKTELLRSKTIPWSWGELSDLKNNLVFEDVEAQ
jgi:hypothetical protein